METKYTYTSPGTIDVTDSAGATTTLIFTSIGQIQKITDSLNRVTDFTYDANDYLSQIVAPGNTVYKFTYDAQGKLLNQTDPLNQTVSFTYGASNTVLSVTDQKGQLMQYGYDASGNLTRITYPGSSFETFTYDASGRLIEAQERSGDIFKYSYDATGRLTRKTFNDNTYEEYTYDSKGNLTAVRDIKGGVTALVYDTNDRLTKITYPNGRFLEYTYNSEGRRTRMVDQSGFTVNYSYDTEGQLTGLTNSGGSIIVAYAYDAVGRLVKETNGNGTYTTYSYDSAEQLLKITNFKADNTINSTFEYIYDNLGRQTTAKTPDGTWSYTYDATGQLTGANFASTNSAIPDQTLSYTYDAAGNRTRIVVNGIATDYTSNALNQYTTVGTAAHSYDADGNLISVVDGTKTWTYTYNDENRLIRVVAPEGTWDYEYDPFGNRTASVFNGQRTEYLVDPFGLGDVVGEYDSSGLVADYVHGIGLVGRFNGNNAAYYDSDFIGSTVGLTSTTGSYVNRYAYRPFGENLITTEGVANPFEYVGQWGVMDEVHGLDFMRARFYSSETGKLTSSDPLGITAGDTNFYRYVFNDPITLIDPSGLCVSPDVYDSALSRATGLGALQGSMIGWRVGASLGTLLGGGIGLIFGGYPLGRLGIELGFQLGGFVGGIIGSIVGAYYAERLLNSTITPCESPEPRTPSNYPEEAAGSASRGRFDPLVLDLDGDGVELVSIDQSEVLFDLNADGFKEQTGWVKGDDGMLALDANGDGQINNIIELFGDAVTDGFDELKTLDSNKDNVINASDTQFSQLQIWRDLNQDGITNAGELAPLTQFNISSISLTTTETNVTNEGNLIRSTGKYTLTDGTQRDAVSLWFAVDRLNTQYDKPYQLKTETLFLPTVRGYGKLPDLYISMSLDSQLLSLAREFVSIQPQNLDQVHGKVEQILYRWAGADNIDPISRGPYFDARKLKFLETFLQQEFNFNFINDRQPIFIRQSWDIIVRAVSARLLAQGPLRDLFLDTSYNLNTDTLVTKGDLATTLDRLKANVPENPANLPLYWSYAVAILDAHENNFKLTETEYNDQIKAALVPSGLSNNLDALRDSIFGTNGNDTFYGDPWRGSFLIGAEGDDVLSHLPLLASPANEIFVGGEGNDTIPEAVGVDWVIGGAGDDVITRADFSASTNDITINNANNPLIALSTGARIIDVERFLTLTTGSGNDSITMTTATDNLWIFGGAGNDVIASGSGQDHIEGGDGDDILRGGDGNDSDVVFFPGWGLGLGAGLFGGSGNDQIFGEAGNDYLEGGDGNDTLDGGVDNDTLNGGAGNDALNGRDGNDYLNPGAGIDQVIGGAGTDLLALDFATVTTATTVTYTNPNSGTVSNGTTFSEVEWVDVITGTGNDTINLSAAIQSRIRSGAGTDFLIGGTGRDFVEGGDGDDIINGGAGDDNDWYVFESVPFTGLFGGAGNDIINGEVGNDRLEGDDGNDTLNGGDGDDTLTGGNGSDWFVFDSETAFTPATVGVDRITDFVKNTDKIVLDKTTFTTLTSPANGSLSSNEFAAINESVNGATVAGASIARIVFNQFNGDLFYNPDGVTAGLGSGGRFASFAGSSPLSATDFLLRA